MFSKNNLKKHYGAWLGLLVGTCLGIFVNITFFLLPIIIGEAFDRQRNNNCGTY